jgi:hypothetical protein
VGFAEVVEFEKKILQLFVIALTLIVGEFKLHGGSNKQKGAEDASSAPRNSGARYWFRTSDPCRVKAVLYH